jgi:hypothetical protein
MKTNMKKHANNDRRINEITDRVTDKIVDFVQRKLTENQKKDTPANDESRGARYRQNPHGTCR